MQARPAKMDGLKREFRILILFSLRLATLIGLVHLFLRQCTQEPPAYSYQRRKHKQQWMELNYRLEDLKKTVDNL